MRVLFVEDDVMIADVVRGALQDASYAVDWVQDAEAMQQAVAARHYDVLLLDLGLPGMSGEEALAWLRTNDYGVPTIIVSARDSVRDRVRGLDTGADDYLPKPFDMEELLARMRAVARRLGGSGSPVLTHGDLSLDPSTHQARLGGATAAQLTRREFALLRALMARPGTILSRAELEDRIYGWGEEVESNAVEFLIHAVRRKLGTSVIKNVRGVGWLISKAA